MLPAIRRRSPERDIQRAIVSLLRWHGWMVREISQQKYVTGDLIGVPDLIAWKRGVTLLIEVKAPGGRVRRSQRLFAQDIAPHLGDTLRYTITRDVDQFEQWLNNHESE